MVSIGVLLFCCCLLRFLRVSAAILAATVSTAARARLGGLGQAGVHYEALATDHDQKGHIQDQNYDDGDKDDQHDVGNHAPADILTHLVGRRVGHVRGPSERKKCSFWGFVLP